ncbi:MAG: DUF4893 domain-containing protein [Pseudomonadota bacterium]|nr:DUF4893 domain-containing protein [Pseudomonadota bacterium]
MRLVLLAFAFVLAGCSTLEPPNHVVHAQHDWRTVATEADRARLRGWRTAFSSALALARTAGFSAEIAREGALLQPDAAIGGPIPNGMYRCRVIKLGSQSQGMLDYVAYPDFACRVQQQGQVQTFAKLTGSQRQVGLIFPFDAMRQVFLGTLMLGDEARAMHYGVDPERDVAGYVERIARGRWRLVMPSPRFESQLDVMELVPAP